MRNLLLKVHLYSGLICFWYLIILGTSSLNFNHHFPFMDGNGDVRHWSEKVSIQNNFNDDQLLAHTLRDSLSLIGWPLPWETWHDSTGVFHFALQHPGKRYLIDYTFTDQTARVQEVPKGLWGIFNAMHGMGSVPNSLLMDAWMWYSRATVVLIVFSVFTGVYLWYRGRRDKNLGFYAILASVIVSLAWMLQLYLYG